MSRDAAVFADLPLQNQLDLHDYYALSVPITVEQALRHRAEMTKAFPSLPQKAGRAYEAFRAAIDGPPNRIIDRHRRATTTTEVIAGERRSLRIVGIAHPRPDQYRLARALLALANDPKVSAELDRLLQKKVKRDDDPSAASPHPKI
jgi:hypothetical protein